MAGRQAHHGVQRVGKLHRHTGERTLGPAPEGVGRKQQWVKGGEKRVGQRHIAKPVGNQAAVDFSKQRTGQGGDYMPWKFAHVNLSTNNSSIPCHDSDCTLNILSG